LHIVHINVAGNFTEGMTYQGNLISKYNRLAGHSVTIIAGLEMYDEGKIIRVPSTDTVLTDGIRLIRLPVRFSFISALAKRFRQAIGLSKLLSILQPDIIMFHDVQSIDLLTVVNHKLKHPWVKLYADSHSDAHNSATNLISLHLLHRIFYRYIIKRCLQEIDKIFFVSLEAKDFLQQNYGINITEKLEFLPLGGEPISPEVKAMHRKKVRTDLKLDEKDIVLCHSGKFGPEKATYELVKAFREVQDDRLKLLVIGMFPNSEATRVVPLFHNDNRIIFLGWKTGQELMVYIAASDLYVQPGSQSATMQGAICAGTPALFRNFKSHEPYIKGNAITIDSLEELTGIIDDIAHERVDLSAMSKKAFDLAHELLDYRKLAARIAM
jgi:glycosyltransferase involved in cell wall biosynthesis